MDSVEDLHSMYADLASSGDFSVHTQLRLQDTQSRLYKRQQDQQAMLQAYERIGSVDFAACTETTQDPNYDYMTRQQYKRGVWQCPPGWTDTKCADRSLQCKKPKGQEPVPQCTETQADPAYEYTTRYQNNGVYMCPEGWTDTKCAHRDGPSLSGLQCKRLKSAKSETRCTETSRDPAYEYTKRRQYKKGLWQCPPGYINTRCSRKDGSTLQDLQCKRRIDGTTVDPQACTETGREPGAEYTTKVKNAKGKYVCPDGFTSTKCTHRDGPVSVSYTHLRAHET